VYASPQQVFPKRSLTLVLGLMGGLMLGLLFTLGRRVLQQQRTTT
jgi:LPS O-antigen subunit length determinant protein (WzzB/FepE family)